MAYQEKTMLDDMAKMILVDVDLMVFLLTIQ
ncbi:Uncharacterised protein [Neisseria animaloris]|nr:Uncharacterised protein [Neisseria animaloris]